MTDVRLLPEAEFDLAEAALFLDHRAPGLGNSLADEVDNAIRRLQENPPVGPDRGGGVHSLLVHRFPYSVIYRILSDHVLILAIAHHRRLPGYWHERRALREEIRGKTEEQDLAED